MIADSTMAPYSHDRAEQTKRDVQSKTRLKDTILDYVRINYPTYV